MAAAAPKQALQAHGNPGNKHTMHVEAGAGKHSSTPTSPHSSYLHLSRTKEPTVSDSCLTNWRNTCRNRQISASVTQITTTTPHFLSPHRDFCNPIPSQRGTGAGERAQPHQTEPGGLFEACFVNLKAILSSWSLTAA